MREVVLLLDACPAERGRRCRHQPGKEKGVLGGLARGAKGPDFSWDQNFAIVRVELLTLNYEN